MKIKDKVILYVEDDPAHFEIFRRSLAKVDRNCRVVHVENGEKALQYLLRQGDYADPEKAPRPHLIITDINMPNINGIELLKIIRTLNEFTTVPIIILTTSDNDQDIIGAYSNNVNSYLVKPCDGCKYDELVNTVHKYWLSFNQ